MAFAMVTHWVCNFAIGQLFLPTVAKFGVSTVYLGFATVCVVASVFVQVRCCQSPVDLPQCVHACRWRDAWQCRHAAFDAQHGAGRRQHPCARPYTDVNKSQNTAVHDSRCAGPSCCPFCGVWCQIKGLHGRAQVAVLETKGRTLEEIERAMA